MDRIIERLHMSVLNHPGKDNVVEDALSYMTIGSVCHIEERKKDLEKDVHRFARLGVWSEDSPNGGIMVHNNRKSSLVV